LSASVEAVLQAMTTRSGLCSAIALPITYKMRVISASSGMVP